MRIIRRSAVLSRSPAHVLVVAIVLVAAGALCSAAQEPAKLEVRVTSPKPKLLIWEPLVLNVEVKNVGQTDVKQYDMRPGDFGYAISVCVPLGGTVSYQPGGSAEPMRVNVKTVALAPGETYRHREVIVCFSSLSYVIGDLGGYSVEVSFSPDGRPESAVQAGLSVAVREPKGLDAAAFELFEGRRQALFMAGRTDQRSIDEFQRLATEYPQTVYGRYARYYLAKALIAPRPQYAKSPYAKAARFLEGLVSEDSDFPLADQCMLDLAECYEQTDRKDEAKAILGKLIERFPESPVAAPAKKKLDSLQPPTPTPQVPQQADAKPEPEAVPQPKAAEPPPPAE